MSDPLKKVISIIVQVAEPEKIILFGSHATGNAKPGSDYNLLVLKRGVNYISKLHLYKLIPVGAASSRDKFVTSLT